MTGLIIGAALILTAAVLFVIALPPRGERQARRFLRADSAQGAYAVFLVGLSGAGLVLTLAGLGAE
ncbi:hypothetical protein [Ancylobacter sp. IITR112]|uniref:hypothetical protein n=1 Tax=Ancylobacter sp. IITR112 TaxID=3138073 RepID=UPI00352BB0B7